MPLHHSFCPSLPQAWCFVPSSFFPSITSLFIKLQCDTQNMFLSEHLYMQIHIAMSHWSHLRSLVSEAPETLDYHWDSSPISVVIQNQGNLLVGQDIQGAGSTRAPGCCMSLWTWWRLTVGSPLALVVPCYGQGLLASRRLRTHPWSHTLLWVSCSKTVLWLWLQFWW